MKKKFKMMADHLEIVVTHSDDINFPIEGKSVVLGKASGTQIQKIDLDKVPVLLDFLEKDFDQGKEQLKAIETQLEQLGEPLQLGEELVEACTKILGKGTKILKQKMLVLSNHLETINKVKALKKNKEFLEKRLNPAKQELTDLKEAIK